MFFINLIITLIAGYFAYEEYHKGRIGWAMFWSILLGWDLNTLINVL